MDRPVNSHMVMWMLPLLWMHSGKCVTSTTCCPRLLALTDLRRATDSISASASSGSNMDGLARLNSHGTSNRCHQTRHNNRRVARHRASAAAAALVVAAVVVDVVVTLVVAALVVAAVVAALVAAWLVRWVIIAP